MNKDQNPIVPNRPLRDLNNQKISNSNSTTSLNSNNSSNTHNFNSVNINKKAPVPPPRDDINIANKNNSHNNNNNTFNVQIQNKKIINARSDMNLNRSLDSTNNSKSIACLFACLFN